MLGVEGMLSPHRGATWRRLEQGSRVTAARRRVGIACLGGGGLHDNPLIAFPVFFLACLHALCAFICSLAHIAYIAFSRPAGRSARANFDELAILPEARHRAARLRQPPEAQLGPASGHRRPLARHHRPVVRRDNWPLAAATSGHTVRLRVASAPSAGGATANNS